MPFRKRNTWNSNACSQSQFIGWAQCGEGILCPRHWVEAGYKHGIRNRIQACFLSCQKLSFSKELKGQYPQVLSCWCEVHKQQLSGRETKAVHLNGSPLSIPEPAGWRSIYSQSMPVPWISLYELQNSKISIAKAILLIIPLNYAPRFQIQCPLLAIVYSQKIRVGGKGGRTVDAPHKWMPGATTTTTPACHCRNRNTWVQVPTQL